MPDTIDFDLQFLETQVPEHRHHQIDDLDILLGCGSTDRFRADLEELAVAPGLGPIVAIH